MLTSEREWGRNLLGKINYRNAISEDIASGNAKAKMQLVTFYSNYNNSQSLIISLMF